MYITYACKGGHALEEGRADTPAVLAHTYLAHCPGDNPGANRWFLQSTHVQMHLTEVASVCTGQRSWYFIAKQPAPAPHLANPEGCDAVRIVQAGSRAKGTTLWRKEAPTRPRYSPREMR